ncbi:MAG: M14 family metallopeptidase [Ferruginibacter sp.]
MIRFVLLVFFSFVTIAVSAQIDYSNAASQTARLQAVVAKNTPFAKLASLGKTAGGKDIWMLTLGNGNTEAKPAIAIIGGVEGNHLLGTELAIGFAENMVGSNNDSVKALLNNTTFYIFPNMSPDAMEQYFAKLKYERMGNASATDDDRDGKTNEDGYDDLDGNGKITMMRVQSPVGMYRINTEDSRSMVKADLAKGETGGYLMLTEGLDNDKDGLFNEDGPGGVWFNKNFAFRHPSFTPGSGEFPVSEIENRLLLDKLYQLFNVYAVVSFSSANNLSTPFTFNAANTTPRVITGYLEEDARINAMVSDLYIKTTSLKDAPKSAPAGGDLLSWGYYHYGRLSFSTPGWFLPKPKADTTKKEKSPLTPDSVANYLRWAAAQNLPDQFTPWKKINHPSFPNQLVEVGGIDPFVLINPPFDMAAAITARHTAFIQKLAALQPRVAIENITTEKLGNNIFRITATVMNTGALPSHTKIGERSYWVKKINVALSPAKNQVVISGKKLQLLNTLEGFGTKELTWLVKGSGTTVLEAGSPTTGTKRVEIKL